MAFGDLVAHRRNNLLWIPLAVPPAVTQGLRLGSGLSLQQWSLTSSEAIER
jgi:hypothetical protein